MTFMLHSGEVLISSPGDFPFCQVSKSDGPVYRIYFKNREYVGRWMGMLRLCLALTAGLFGMYFGIWVAVVLGIIGIPALLIGIAIAFIVIYRAIPATALYRRRVDINVPKDLLQTFYGYKSKRAAFTRRWSAYRDAEITGHPLAATERDWMAGGIGIWQMQHCLVGYFGIGGAEKAIMLTRYEWPVQNSLIEIKQAIEWVRHQQMVGDDPGQMGGRVF